MIYSTLFFIFSVSFVALGQPAWSTPLSLFTALMGHALFWGLLLRFEKKSQRFWLGTLWFFCVQFFQLSWFASHPFLYIYSVHFGLALLLGVQYGILSVLITSIKGKSNLPILGLASLWAIFEWSRLFILSGFTWNPVGLALSANIYSMQMANLWGVFGLSFWVMIVNLLALKAWIFFPSKKYLFIWVACGLLPFVYGFGHIWIHDKANANSDTFNAILVQTAFPIEEVMQFDDMNTMVNFVTNEWEQILQISAKHDDKPVDLIILPELVVPFGTYSFLYPLDLVKSKVSHTLGKKGLEVLPRLESPLAEQMQTPSGPTWMVNNAYWIQLMANYFHSGIVVGLEDAEDVGVAEREHYSAAVYLRPQEEFFGPLDRYEKRVLVPMGEYIPYVPWNLLKSLAARYGVSGSFTCGREAKIMNTPKAPFGVSICYEETFGHIMRENKQKGAKILVNLTSDVWYPNSKLPRQHFDHSRLRSVENGMPLLRSCNTGITGACDGLGRIVSILGDEDPEAVEWVPDSLYVKIPIYSYPTMYSFFGDALIVSLAFILGTINLLFIHVTQPLTRSHNIAILHELSRSNWLYQLIRKIRCFIW